MGDEKHNDEFFYDEDRAAAKMGENCPVEDVTKLQEKFRQRSYEDDREAERLRIENLTERLYQLAKQEGVIGEDPVTEQGGQVYYSIVWQYIESGGEVPTWEWEQNEGREYLKKLYEGLQDIEHRDQAGEWEEGTAPNGDGTIPKVSSPHK